MVVRLSQPVVMLSMPLVGVDVELGRRPSTADRLGTPIMRPDGVASHTADVGDLDVRSDGCRPGLRRVPGGMVAVQATLSSRIG